LGNKGPLKVLNGTKLILDDHGNNLDSFKISLESFRSFRGPLLLKPVTGQELFFAESYSKPALEEQTAVKLLKNSKIVPKPSSFSSLNLRIPLIILGK
jgi:hypothetical protein